MKVKGVAQQPPLQHSAAGDVDVGRDVVLHPAFEVLGDAGEAVGPVHPEQQHLSPVTEHKLEIGVAGVTTDKIETSMPTQTLVGAHDRPAQAPPWRVTGPSSGQTLPGAGPSWSIPTKLVPQNSLP